MSTHEPRRVALAVVAAALGSLLVCTCVVPRSGHRVPAPVGAIVVAAGPRMDHVAHAARGLECADCHRRGLSAQDEPQRPTYAACAECHDDEDSHLPPERRVRNVFFAPDGAPRWPRAIASYDPEVVFRHANHAATACATCHGPMAGAA